MHVYTSQLCLLQTEVVYVMGKGAFPHHWKRTRNPKVAFLACSHVWSNGNSGAGNSFSTDSSHCVTCEGEEESGQDGLLSLGNRLLILSTGPHALQPTGRSFNQMRLHAGLLPSKS